MGAPRNFWRLPVLFVVAAVACCHCATRGASRISLADGESVDLIFTNDSRLPSDRMRVCLIDRTRGTGALAFDLDSIDPPRWLARPGKSTCADFAKVRQTFRFWKFGHGKRPVVKLRASIDLDARGANRLSLLWLGKRQ